MRDFSGFDGVTGHQLSLLEQQSNTEAFGGPKQLQVMVGHVIDLVRMLPRELQRLIPTHRCTIGATHWDQPDAWCHEVWRGITADLRTGLDQVEARRLELLASPETLTDRPATIGEQVLALCREGKDRGFDAGLARQIEHLAAGHELGGDARELARLLTLTRRTSAHSAEVYRRIRRIEAAAQQLHYR
jgi:hypothetical protein